MIDRKITPEINPILNLNISPASKLIFNNGTPFYYVHSNSSELIKIEWMFAAGNWYQNHPLLAFAVNNTLSEGTRNFSSSLLVEKIEFYGASLGYSVDKDNAYVSLISMRKHLPKVMPLMEELIKYPIFPEKEIEIFRHKHKQHFLVEQTKVNSLARTHHSSLLFGSEHPYGKMIIESDFDTLVPNLMADFHQKFYHCANCSIIASGKVLQEDIDVIAQYFGNQSWGNVNKLQQCSFDVKTSADVKVFIEKPDAVQNAIRIGKVIFNKTSNDYAGFTVLNCILGGYFGSRLMKKIREEKGYTYGINSLHVSLVRDGYFTIVSEVGSEVTAPALADIYNEIEILRTELVPEEELTRVRNYMLGDMVRMFDGPFAQAESLISLLEYDIDYEHFNEVANVIRNIKSEEICDLAIKYLNPASMTEVVVGKRF
jgi:zinc protease